jgi:ribosomal protein L7Ae-like RNA K-turn-binding protein
MDKVLSMIGMAKRAGKTSSGGFLCERAIRDGSARLIVLAADISENSGKSIKNACEHYNVRYITYGDKDSLGTFTGGGDRAVVSINDDNFASAVLQKYEAEGQPKA